MEHMGVTTATNEMLRGQLWMEHMVGSTTATNERLREGVPPFFKIRGSVNSRWNTWWVMTATNERLRE